jgi:uncharacterized repeat protein (TIGR01451 family)
MKRLFFSLFIFFGIWLRTNAQYNSTWIQEGVFEYDCIDINNDGLLDIVYSPETFQVVNVLYNNGGLSFSDPIEILNTGISNWIFRETADFDGNGLFDLAGSKYVQGSGWEISVFLQTGPFQFSDAIIIPTSDARELFNAIDIDTDGYDELVFMCHYLDGVELCNPDDWPGIQTIDKGWASANIDQNGIVSADWIYRPCDGNDFSSAGVGDFSWNTLNHIDAKDINGDGINDFIAMYGAMDTEGLLAWTSGTNLSNLPLSTNEIESIRNELSTNFTFDFNLVDFENDGDLDYSSNEGNPCFQFLTNDGNGSFSEPTFDYQNTTAILPQIEVSDVNSDGFKDFVYSGYGILDDGTEFTGTYVLYNDGSNALIGNCVPFYVPSMLSPVMLNKMKALDLNGDNIDEFIGLFYNEQQSTLILDILYQTGVPASIPCYSFIDSNLNGLWDESEQEFPFLEVHSSSQLGALYTSISGELYVSVPSGESEINATFNDALWEITTTSSYIVEVVDGVATPDELYFGFSPIGEQHHLNVNITDLSSGCSSYSYFRLDIQNAGNTAESGELNFTISNLYEFVESTPAPIDVDNNVVQWQFDELQPGLTQTFLVKCLTPDASLFGTEIIMSSIVSVTDDLGNLLGEFESDLIYEFECSYDPNDKSESTGIGESGNIGPNTALNYTIRFQNTGNAAATNVRIEDTLSELLQWNTIQPLAWSHPFEMELDQNGKLTFFFNQIMLPDSTSDEPGSHGYVIFSIEQLSDLPAGTEITNTAEIFFDANDPIVTNTTLNTIHENLLPENYYFIDGASWGIEYGTYETAGGPGYYQSANRVNVTGDGTIELGGNSFVRLLEEGISISASYSQDQFGNWNSFYSESPYSPSDAYKFVRSEDKRIYAWNNETNSEYLVIDYDQEVGDTLVYSLDQNDYHIYPILSIDSILISNNYRRIFYVEFSDIVSTNIFVEGIGHMGTAPFGMTTPNVSFLYDHFLCYTYDNETYVPSQNYMPEISSNVCTFSVGIDEKAENTEWIVFPIPASDVITIQNNSGRTMEGILISNSLGEKVYEKYGLFNQMTIDTSNWPSGVYFVQSETKVIRIIKL